MRTRFSTFGSFFAGLLTLGIGVLVAGHARADKTVHILVLKENGVMSSAAAQPHMDQLVEVARAAMGWSKASGKLVTRRGVAQDYIKEKEPWYAMISLGAFLAMRQAQGFEVIGNVEVKNGGGRQYFIVSKSAADLAACKGKKLASNHAEDQKFINKVVSGGDFKLGDFDVVTTKRPVQTIKKAIDGDVECALIDDAQKAEMGHIDGGSSLKVAWSSKQLPAMPVVAFSSAPAADRAKFKSSLGSLCTGSGKSSCDQVGLLKMSSGDESAYKKVIKSYGE